MRSLSAPVAVAAAAAGSEVGIVDVAVEKVTERGRLGPGDMLAVDTERGVVLRNEEIKEELSSKRPYQAWLERSITHVAAGRQGLGQIMSYNTLLKVRAHEGEIETRRGRRARARADRPTDRLSRRRAVPHTADCLLSGLRRRSSAPPRLPRRRATRPCPRARRRRWRSACG
jgi:hypothetical protein